MRPRVLVTGAAGFVGRHVLDSLCHHNVDVFAISREQTISADVVTVTLDLLGNPSLDKILADVEPDVVLHLAWNVEHGLFWDSPSNLTWTSATLDLARACLDTSVRRFVGIGTCYEYDWPNNSSCNEQETPVKAHTLYDRAKSNTRELLAELFRNSRIEFAWARVFFLYGPNESPGRLVPSVVARLLRGELAKCSRGLAFRDYMDVRDAGDALTALTLSSFVGDVNISSGNAYRISDIIRMIGRLCGESGLVRMGALKDRLEPPYIVGCNERLKKDVGFSPKIGLEEGLTNAIAFWSRQLSRSPIMDQKA